MAQNQKSKHGSLFLGFLVYSVTFAIVLTALGFWWLSHKFYEDGPLASPSFFEVERGQGLFTIAQNLQKANAIYNADVFKINAVILGAQGELKAGEYQFEARSSQKTILGKLRTGAVYTRRVTIPEGLTSYEIVQILEDVEELAGEISKIPEEGSLLPETYDYRRDEKRQVLIERMQAAMTEAIDELWNHRAAGLPFDTKEEAITLASIVEKETGIASERKRVAGVFINRLHAGIPLQTDPTVIYALTNGKHENEGMGPLGRRLLRKDLNYDSPYNTYKYAGLPPGPIANPGLASIEAVLNPEPHKFIYFVADGTGGHVFAETLAEHNRNVAKWRKIRAQDKESN